MHRLSSALDSLMHRTPSGAGSTETPPQSPTDDSTQNPSFPPEPPADGSEDTRGRSCTDLGTDPPAPLPLERINSDGYKLERAPFEKKLLHVKSMPVPELVSFFHHDDTTDHFHIIRVCLNTILEITRIAALEDHRRRLQSETGVVEEIRDPLAMEITPLLYKYRPKDESPETYKQGYRGSVHIERPINLQKTLLQKLIRAKDFAAIDALLKICRGNLPSHSKKRRMRAAQSIPELKRNEDGVYSHLIHRIKPRPGALSKVSRDVVLSEGNSFVAPSLISILHLFVTGFNNQKTFEVFKLYLEVFITPVEGLSAALAFALRFAAMPLPVIEMLVAEGADPFLRMPELPKPEENWDATGEWMDILLTDVYWAEEDFGKTAAENMTPETPPAVRVAVMKAKSSSPGASARSK
jgi:hypothetical protein